MKIEKIKQENNHTLVICMTGWSISPEFMRSLPIPATADYWLVYDYRDLRFEESFEKYEHVHLIAWSLGVWVASYLWSGKTLFESTTAINGTPYPIDDQRGIPTAIFEGTLQTISENGMKRFNRRMCGDKETFQKYNAYPARPLEAVKEELAFLHQMIRTTTGTFSEDQIFKLWDRTIIATNDRIFPTQNQRNCWMNQCPITEIDAPHLPFFQDLIMDELWKRPQQN